MKTNKNKGKERDWDWEREGETVTMPTNPTGAYIMEDANDDLYEATPPPPNLTTRQIRMALYHRSCNNICDHYSG